MKKFERTLSAFVSFWLLMGMFAPIVALAAVTPSLGSAASYGVLAGTYTNTTPTTINGDVGFTTPPAVVPSGTHANYGSGAPYSAAGTAQGTALSSLNSETCTFTFGAGAINLSTDSTHGVAGIYTPGVYCSSGAMDVGGPLTLSGSGTFIFRPGGALTTTAGASISLIGGASACSVFWTPTQATTLAANTTFVGTVIDAAGITVGANSTWSGRALAFGGTVTTDTTTMTVPVCVAAPATLNVIKTVVNAGGGLATSSTFNLSVKLSGINVSGSPVAGAVTPGTAYSLAAGSYVVSEDANSSYVKSYSGDCNASGEVTLASSDVKTCTVTNTFIPPIPGFATLHVIKVVVNSGTGTAIASDFSLSVKNAGVDIVGSPTVGTSAPGTSYSIAAGTYIVSENVNALYTKVFSGDCDATGSIILASGADKTCTVTNTLIPPVSLGGGGGSSYFPPVVPLIGISKIPSPLSLPGGSGIITYSYTVWNAGIKLALSNVTLSDDFCGPVTYLSGDTDGNGKIEPLENWNYRCLSTLTKTTTNTVTATGYGDDAAHQVAKATAVATVVVGSAVISPRIHLVKSSNRLKPFSFGGGSVIFTYTVTNPGTIALHDLKVTDNKCSPVLFQSGDLNKDHLLDGKEKWIFTCTSVIKTSTTNIGTASGTANGLTAIDHASATVLVSLPKLPNTGFPPKRADKNPVRKIITRLISSNEKK